MNNTMKVNRILYFKRLNLIKHQKEKIEDLERIRFVESKFLNKVVMNLSKENEILRKENEILKEELAYLKLLLN